MRVGLGFKVVEGGHLIVVWGSGFSYRERRGLSEELAKAARSAINRHIPNSQGQFLASAFR